MGEINGTALAAAAIGGIFVYGGIKGKSPLAATQALIRGQNPQTVPQNTGLTGSGVLTATSGGSGSGGVPNVAAGAVQSQFSTFCLQDLHFTIAGTAGAMGNIDHESSWQPSNDTGDGGTSGGLCQWHNDRFTGLKNYAARHKLDWRSVQAQLGWMRVELNGGYADVRVYMMAASSPESAAAYWAKRYEGCSECYSTSTAEVQARMASARAHYNQLQGVKPQ